jgi:hypothetical protein
MYIKRRAKVNISKEMYEQIVRSIEHDPLIRRSTLIAAGLFAGVAILTGLMLWFVLLHPAKLVRTSGTVTSVNSGKTDALGTVTTFINFRFTPAGRAPVTVKAPVTNGHIYTPGNTLTIGYSPLNPNYARNLSHTAPPKLSFVLWAVPPLLAFWFGVVALVRHHERQEQIYAAAEAAGVE